MLRGLIFDVDGVIADTEPLSTSATIAAFESVHNVTTTPEDSLPFMGNTAVDHFRGIGRRHGIDADVAALHAFHNSLLLERLQAEPVPLFSGVQALASAAHESDEWTTALATSSGRNRSEYTLESAGLSPALFDAWLTGDDITHSKPHPEIYLSTADALGVPVSYCVAIEDAVAGVRASKSAGMACVAVSNTFPASELGEANLVVSSLADVTLELLAQLIG